MNTSRILRLENGSIGQEIKLSRVGLDDLCEERYRGKSRELTNADDRVWGLGLRVQD